MSYKPKKKLTTVGQIFNDLTILSEPYSVTTGLDKRKLYAVKCQCKCGKIIEAIENRVSNNLKLSCGCRKERLKKFTNYKKGDKLGYWTLIDNPYVRETVAKDSRRKKPHIRKEAWVKVQCVCGKIKDNKLNMMVYGKSKSCSCKILEMLHEKNKTHRQSKTVLYHKWFGMKGRCYDKTNHGYKTYGGRGIIICDEWKNDFMVFMKWAYVNGYKEHSGLTIDRIDVHGNYCPENCQWVTRSENSRLQTASRDKQIFELKDRVIYLENLLKQNNINFI